MKMDAIIRHNAEDRCDEMYCGEIVKKLQEKHIIIQSEEIDKAMNEINAIIKEKNGGMQHPAISV